MDVFDPPTKEKEDRLCSSGGNIDRIIHEPSRMHIMAILLEVEFADYVFLMNRPA